MKDDHKGWSRTDRQTEGSVIDVIDKIKEKLRSILMLMSIIHVPQQRLSDFSIFYICLLQAPYFINMHAKLTSKNMYCILLQSYEQ